MIKINWCCYIVGRTVLFFIRNYLWHTIWGGVVPSGWGEKINASCVIIIGFLNCGSRVYLVGPGVGCTDYVVSLKMSGYSNTDGSFCTFGLPIVVLIFLIFFKISFSLSILSTGVLIVDWNLGVCLCFNLLVWLLLFLSLLDCGVSYHWGLSSPLKLEERPPSELSGISPSDSWSFERMVAGSIHGVLFLVYQPWSVGAVQTAFDAVGVDDVWQTGD